jgi:Zn-finger nucleic acid-binding protein
VASSKPELVKPEQLEGRLDCPVCLGARMVKIRPDPKQPGLILDYCRRCGGIWFDAGEVGRLRMARPQALYALVTLEPEAFRMKCHRCHAVLKRNDEACAACGQPNVLECPHGHGVMTRIAKDGLVLDGCQRCRGVFFDNVELAEVWNRTVGALARRRPGQVAPGTMDAGDHFLMAAMFFDPWTMAIAGNAIANVAGPALGAAGEVAGQAVEATGELAGGVFSAIAELIGNLFSGLDL